MDTDHGVLGTTRQALLFTTAVWAAALWALVLGEYMLLNGIAEPPVWLMLAWWIIPIIVVGALVTWAIRRKGVRDAA